MNLSQIIEKKKKEFELFVSEHGLECGGYDESGMTNGDIETVKSFLEKVIRDSVEEALREIT